MDDEVTGWSHDVEPSLCDRLPVQTSGNEADLASQAFLLSGLDEHSAVVATDTTETRDRDIL